MVVVVVLVVVVVVVVGVVVVVRSLSRQPGRQARERIGLWVGRLAS